MSQPAADQPEGALLLDLVADVAVLRATLAALILAGNSAALRAVQAALADLAQQSRQAARLSPATALMDEVMQRRLSAFEASLSAGHQRH
ncbi:hypothetical protein EBE87_24385 [Pseudoroseomonas wenyumeiae]|uniref:Uncharacterized protein n=1 Tax=Teichococcus wenyumeiae TaxID=2478470 RepID=A0A3A9J6Q5_9PROT|nr:hypothetical protein [Pseudoroseomonas wenyumeiae]RKK02132.1 hypothetical protein D6Z83_21365 [Pseudoroseomonas wenyumeiae]RMI17025.1 hypothetical protein EBE87_24385 [Pseudoroseomonas wenyumeiae]